MMTRQLDIKSPLVGIVRLAPEEGRPPFVRPGDHVEPESPLCAIEVLTVTYLMRAGTRGVVAGILPADGEPVEFGEVLFHIHPM